MATVSHLFQGQNGVLFSINCVTALAFSLILPIMSLFLVTELGAPPAYIGIYTTLTSLMTLAVSQKMTSLIDDGYSSKGLFVLSLVGIVVSAVGFSLANQFWHALVIGCVSMPIASSSIPLLLTIIRNYADKSGQDSAKLNSQMRSSVSLLWIVGPPLAFFSVENFGFTANFYLSAGAAVLVLAIAKLSLPEATPNNEPSLRTTHATGAMPKEVWYLAIITLIANIGCSIFGSGMPLMVTAEMNLPTSYPGILYGLNAAVEIPIMLLAVNWARRFGKSQVMRFGFFCGLVFYIGMLFAQTMTHLICLQIINGIFYGIFVGLGVTIMQDYAPACIGKASASYTNAMLIGTMLGTSLMGVISQFYGFRSTMLASLATLVVATLLLTMFIRHIDKNHSENTPRMGEFNQ